MSSSAPDSSRPQVHVVQVDVGTPTRLDIDCPSCGWTDIWHVAMHQLSAHGVSTLAEVTRCVRCGHRVVSKGRD